MNKLLLSTFSLLFILANGGYGAEEQRRHEVRPHPITKTQQKPQTEEVVTPKSFGIDTQKRDRRKPDLQSAESNSFGYSWNNGKGVSYLKMHIGHQSGRSGSFGGSFHKGQDFIRGNGHHHKAGLEEINKVRFHEDQFKAIKEEINLEKLRPYSQDNSYDNLGINVLDKMKNPFIYPPRDESNAQAKIRTSINIQSSEVGYDRNQNYEHLNQGFGPHGSDINGKNASSAFDFESSDENILKSINGEIEGHNLYGYDAQSYVRPQENPGYDFGPYSSQSDLFNGANIKQNDFSEHSGEDDDKTISSSYNIEDGRGHEIIQGSEANLYNTQGVNDPANDPEELNNYQGDNYGLQNYADNGYGILSQSDIHTSVPKETETTEARVVPDEQFQEHKALFHTTSSASRNRHFLPQFREDYSVGVQNGMASLGHFPFLGMNQNNYNRFKKHSVSENGGRISRKTPGKEVIDSRLVGPGIYDFIDRNRGSDLVPQGSSIQNIANHNPKAVSSVGTGKNHFENGFKGPQNLASKREESKQHGFTRDQELKQKNKLENTDAIGYSYSSITLGQTHGVLAEDKPMWKGSTFDKQFSTKNELKHNLFVTSKVNHGDKVPSGGTETLQDITAQFIENVNPTTVHSFKGNEGKENLKEKFNTNDTSKNVQNDERKGREIKSVHNFDYKDEKDTAFRHTRGNTDHLLAGNTITEHSFGNGHESEHLEEEISDQEPAKYGYPHQHIFSIFNKPEVREVTRAIPVHKELRIPVPHPVRQPILIPVPVRVLEPFHIHIPFPVPVEKTVEVPVEKVIPYPVEKPVPVKVYKKVSVPVPKPYPVKVPVYKVKYIYHNLKKHH